MNKSLLVCSLASLFVYTAFGQAMNYGDMVAHDETDQGIDAGNWYEKLHWWKEARQLYSVDIHEAMEHLKSIEQEYELIRKSLLDQLTTSYSSLPIARAAAGHLIKSLLDDLTAKIAKAEEAVSQAASKQAAEEKKDLDQLQEQRTLLEKLSKEFDLQNMLADRLDEALNKVSVRQIALCHDYEERALTNFEKIEQVYDDKKAHEFYNVVENSLENIHVVSNYLAGPLRNYIDQIWKRFQQGMPQLTKTIESLDALGVEIRILTPEQKAQKDALRKQQGEARLKAAAEKKAAEARLNMSWWQKLIAAIGKFFSSLWNSILGLFSSAPTAPVAKPVVKKVESDKPAPMPALPKLTLPGSS